MTCRAVWLLPLPPASPLRQIRQLARGGLRPSGARDTPTGRTSVPHVQEGIILAQHRSRAVMTGYGLSTKPCYLMALRRVPLTDHVLQRMYALAHGLYPHMGVALSVTLAAGDGQH